MASCVRASDEVTSDRRRAAVTDVACEQLGSATTHTPTHPPSSVHYIRQVNGVKLADILFYLRFRPSVRPSVRTHI